MKKIMRRIVSVVLAASFTLPAGLFTQAEDAPQNVASGKPVAVSKQSDFLAQNYPKERLTDGNVQATDETSCAIIEWDDDQLAWYEIDLQGVTKLNQITLWFHNSEWPARPLDFAIDVRTQDAWVRVAEQHMSAHDAMAYTYSFAPAEAKRIRVTASCARANRNNFRLAEVTACYDPTAADVTPVQKPAEGQPVLPLQTANLAEGKPVSCSGQSDFFAQSYPLSNLTDGNADMTDERAIINWQESSDEAWYEIDLGAAKMFNQISLTNSFYDITNAPLDFAVDVLTETDWIRVAEQHVQENAAGIHTYSFAPVTAKKIRVTASSARSAAKDFYQLVEAAVYHNPSVTPDAYTPLQQPAGGQPVLTAPLLNYAKNKPVYVSRQSDWLSENFPAAHLTDGHGGGGEPAIIEWDANGLAFYEVDLEAVRTVSQIELYYHMDELTSRPLDFAVFALTEDNAWERVAEQHPENNDGAHTVLRFAPVACDRLRIIANTARSKTKGNYRLLELEACDNWQLTADMYTPLDTAPHYQTQIPEPDQPKNLLQNKPVTAEKQHAFLEENFPLSNLTDGKKEQTDTAAIVNWDANGLGWYEVACGATLNQVKLYYQNEELGNRPLDFALDALVDGKWVRVAEQHIEGYDDTLIYTLNFALVTAEKLRLTGSAARVDNGNFRLLELEGYSNPLIGETEYTSLHKAPDASCQLIRSDSIVNVAVGSRVQSSCTSDFLKTNFPAENAADGKRGPDDTPAVIDWNDKGVAWYQLVFDQPTSLNQVKLFYHNAEWSYRPLDFAIDVFTQGKWVRVAEQHVTGYTASDFVYNFAAVSCTKVRVTASNKGLMTGNYRLAEIEACLNPLITEAAYTPLMSAPDAASAVPMPAAGDDEETDDKETTDKENGDNVSTGYAFPSAALLLAGAAAVLVSMSRKFKKRV